MSFAKLLLSSLALFAILVWLADRWLDHRERRRQAQWNLRHSARKYAPPADGDEIEGDH